MKLWQLKTILSSVCDAAHLSEVLFVVMLLGPPCSTFVEIQWIVNMNSQVTKCTTNLLGVQNEGIMLPVVSHKAVAEVSKIGNL